MKKILTIALAVSMLAAMSVPVFADSTNNEIVTISTETTETPVLISDVAQPVVKAEYLTVKAVAENKITANDGTNDVEVDAEGAIIYNTNGETKAIADIKADNKVDVYTLPDETKVIIINEENAENAVNVDLYKKSETLGEYVNSTNDLAINVAEDAEVVDVNGEKAEVKDNEYLAVFYNIATMSIPAITNPVKVVVLGTAEEAVPTEKPMSYEIPADEVIEKDGVQFVPVRKIAEGMDLQVGWDGDNMAVTVGTVQMGVSFKIGENAYSKSKMVPMTLESAPELINDTTYVPLSFFKDVVEANVVVK